MHASHHQIRSQIARTALSLAGKRPVDRSISGHVGTAADLVDQLSSRLGRAVHEDLETVRINVADSISESSCPRGSSVSISNPFVSVQFLRSADRL